MKPIILLDVFPPNPIEEGDGLTNIDVITFLLIAIFIVVIYLLFRRRKIAGSAQNSLNNDVLGQERSMPLSNTSKPPFTNFSNKDAYLWIVLALFVLIALFTIKKWIP
ncbi:MAG: hypothetical protein MK078_15310 [Crocinitomicaceae bacterium]|nr:hypothetical protein [Crocinitomicaceae bacterium]